MCCLVDGHVLFCAHFIVFALYILNGILMSGSIIFLVLFDTKHLQSLRDHAAESKKCKVECEIYYRHAEYIFDGLRKPTTSGRVLISNRLDSYVFTFQSIPSACKRKTILAHFAPISGFGSKFQLHISGFLVLSLSNRVACFEL